MTPSPTPSEIKPHIYSPNHQAMGDCNVCGYGSSEPWHRATPSEGEAMKRFDERTPDRMACLKVVATAHISMSHDDLALLPFCDDKSTLTDPDIFNQCHEAGWLKSWHDGRLDCSYVELTEQGRRVLRDTPREGTE